MDLRYPSGEIADDTLGKDRLRALIDHAVQCGDARRVTSAIERWASRISEDELARLLSRCGLDWSPGELGMLFDLTVDERSALKITTIRPAGFSDGDMDRLRRAAKAASEQRRRARRSAEARAVSREAADDGTLSERDKIVFAQSLSIWRSTTEIAKDLERWPEFEGLHFPSVRKAVIRSCKMLIEDGRLESEMRAGIRRQNVLFVRRRAGVHAVFVTGTPGHEEHGQRATSSEGAT